MPLVCIVSTTAEFAVFIIYFMLIAIAAVRFATHNMGTWLSWGVDVFGYSFGLPCADFLHPPSPPLPCFLPLIVFLFACILLTFSQCYELVLWMWTLIVLRVVCICIKLGETGAGGDMRHVAAWRGTCKLHSLCRKFGSPYLGETTAAARAALPIPTIVCSTFVCPHNGMTASVWNV